MTHGSAAHRTHLPLSGQREGLAARVHITMYRPAQSAERQRAVLARHVIQVALEAPAVMVVPAAAERQDRSAMAAAVVITSAVSRREVRAAVVQTVAVLAERMIILITVLPHPAGIADTQAPAAAEHAVTVQAAAAVVVGMRGLVREVMAAEMPTIPPHTVSVAEAVEERMGTVIRISSQAVVITPIRLSIMAARVRRTEAAVAAPHLTGAEVTEAKASWSSRIVPLPQRVPSHSLRRR